MSHSHSRYCLLLLAVLFAVRSTAQTETAFIKLVEPLKSSTTVTSSKQFIIGSTCKTCTLQFNDSTVKVYSTGAFAIETRVISDTSFILKSTTATGKSTTKTVQYLFKQTPAALPVSTFEIASIQTFPEGNRIMIAGDKVKFRVKAFP